MVNVYSFAAPTNVCVNIECCNVQGDPKEIGRYVGVEVQIGFVAVERGSGFHLEHRVPAHHQVRTQCSLNTLLSPKTLAKGSDSHRVRHLSCIILVLLFRASLSFKVGDTSSKTSI